MKNFKDASDQDLLIRIKEDNEDAFSAIFHRYWQRIFHVAINRIQDEEKAEEIVQDVFMSLWNRRKEVSIQHSLMTYLSVATKYQIINYQTREFKKNQSIKKMFSKEETGENTTENWLEERELFEMLEQSMMRLPEKCRTVFLLSRHESLSNGEIAKQLQISEKTVEAHITRALRKLKKIFKSI